MLTNIVNKRKAFLYSYALIDKLPLYFERIKGMAGKYKYVSATERRCFNLISYYLPTIGNMTSNSGLLLQYREIVDHYVDYKDMPPILVLDDIMVYGRGMAKFLDQLEGLLYTELEKRNYFDADEKKYRFRRDFSRAIDIYVYARNAGILLLADRFVKKLKCVKELEIRDLRDLSQQLSDYLRRKDIANTSYVCSFRNEAFADKLLQKAKTDVGAKHNWVRIPWNYEDEKMLLYCRLYGNNTINRISTIRLFPDRIEDKSPRMTSYTLIPPMEKSTLDELCKSLVSILQSEESAYEGIIRILNEDKSLYLQPGRGQIVSFMLSLIDFFSFYYEEMQGDGTIEKAPLYSDLAKIACNFGPQNSSLSEEFARLAQNRNLLRELGLRISSHLENSKYNLMDIDPETCIDNRFCDSDIRTINDIVEDIFYNVGLNAETHAYDRYRASYIFSPAIYQEFVERKTSVTISREFQSYGSDGVINFSNFGRIIMEKKGAHFSEKFYGYMAAYIAMMDYGVMSNRLHFITAEKTIVPKENKQYTLAKAGEMAIFRFPKQIAIFLPAFAKIEDRCHRIGLSAEEAVLYFYKRMYNFDYSKIFEQQDCGKWERFKKEWPKEEEMNISTKRLYSSGQRFRNWCFPNLYYQKDAFMQRGQEYIYSKALEFLLLAQE